MFAKYLLLGNHSNLQVNTNSIEIAGTLAARNGNYDFMHLHLSEGEFSRTVIQQAAYRALIFTAGFEQ